MSEPVSVKLNNLFEKTAVFLASFNDKEQWQGFYPVICQLSEQYRVLYSEQPFALQAQLCLYNPKYDYANNLVIKQCILTTVMCASQNYNKELSELYISAALVEHLCVCKQLNKLSEQTSFTNNDKKHWQLRHQLAAKVLLLSGDSVKLITQILAKINKYKQALVSTPKIMLYDNGLTLVALANIIVMNITYTSSNKQISLFKALSDLYIKTPNIFAQKIIKALIRQIGPLLPGSRVLYAEQSMVYLATDQQQRHLLVNPYNNKKITWYRVKVSLNDNSKQWRCNDENLHLDVWSSEHIAVKKVISQSESVKLLDLISQIKLKHEYSYKGLSNIMAEHKNLIANLCEAVQPYNKDHIPAKDLKHSLSMVGYYNAPAIIQRVVFEQLVNVIPHPLHAYIINRLNALVKIMALLVSKNKKNQFEHITLPLYAYVHFLMTQYSTQLSRKTLIDDIPNKTMNVPIFSFFGVNAINNEHLTQQLTHLLSDNPWTITLLEAEQTLKKHLKDSQKLWVTLKIIAQSIFKPEIELTVWQQQILNEQLKIQKWSSSTDFHQELVSLGLSNTI
ncbi:hypothetical protein [Pseudoalteromonas distincta]|uniref:hypothetical protein n=1 Tax=Pseudoalteromonas distincta TaxID=77608 RepID=UPI0034E8CCCE